MEKYAITAGKGIATITLALAASYLSPSFAQDATQPVTESATKDTKKEAPAAATDTKKNNPADPFADLEKRIKEIKVEEGKDWLFYHLEAVQKSNNGALVDAIAYSRKAHELNKAAYEPLQIMGVAYTNLARNKPNDERNAYCDKAGSLLRESIENAKKDIENAKKHIENAKKDAKNHLTKPDERELCNIHVRLGEALEYEGKTKEALKNYKDAQKLSPGNQWAQDGIDRIEAHTIYDYKKDSQGTDEF